VLVVYSTRRDAQVALVGERELPRIVEDGLRGRLDYYAEFIDPARFSDSEYQEALSTFLREKYQDHRFEVIVAVGGDATAFADKHREIFAGAPPLVFYGTSRAMRRPADSTGVIGELDFASTVSLAAALDPSLRHVYVVSGADGGDRATQRIAVEQLRPFQPRLEIVYFSGLPTRELEEKLRQLPPHSMVLYLVVGLDGAGQYFHPLRYLERVIAAANAPTYSWVDSTVGLGVVGGSLKSQSAQMQAVANLTLRVLRGERADAIPVAYPDLSVDQVDWRQLRRWGLRESLVPAGAVVLFREPSLWERYKSYVVVALVLLLAQSGLIAGLLVERRQRRKAEEDLRANQGELRTSYERIRDLGSRLLKGQETERAHIARELHDDVAQQLALIEMDLTLLASGQHADTRLTSEVLHRVQGVGRSLRELSHRLHPAKLRLIGIIVALKGLQEETAPSGITVAFTHNGVPASLPSDVTLALFRVAQEALQNARKSSGARHVSIDLLGTPEIISLTIRDDGRGFDVKDAWGRGLGLVSMRERVEGVGGRLHIQSAAGAGTRLDVHVPLGAAERGSVAV
jgi:signal transduction histidine kinase